MGSMATKCQLCLELPDRPGYMFSIILGLRSKLLRDLSSASFDYDEFE